MNTTIPKGQLCDSGCGQLANYFSKGTGRYRCAKSANSCPANKSKNSKGIKKAHAEGRAWTFNQDHRNKAQISKRHRLVQNTPFEKIGYTLRKKIVMEEQDYKCLHCGLSQWMNLRITLELDHIDGNNKNNNRKNLRCLCPNCHSITNTWKIGQNKGRCTRKCTDEEIITAFKKSDSFNATLKELNYNWGNIKTVKKVLFQHNLINSL